MKIIAAELGWVLVIPTWARQTVITSLLDIFNEHFLHLISAYTKNELLIGLSALLSERVSQLITKRRRQLSLSLRRSVIVESLRRVMEWSAVTLILVLAKEVVGIICDCFVQRLLDWEPLTL